MRQAKLLHSFKAHDHAVKCLAMDSNETIFCTGSVDGDIKVWDLSWHRAVHSYPGEHARHGLFKNISQGVAQVKFNKFWSERSSCAALRHFRQNVVATINGGYFYPSAQITFLPERADLLKF